MRNGPGVEVLALRDRRRCAAGDSSIANRKEERRSLSPSRSESISRASDGEAPPGPNLTVELSILVASMRLDVLTRTGRGSRLLGTMRFDELKEMNVVEGCQKLRRSANKSPDDEERAAVHYVLWRLTGSGESRATAAQLFRGLFQQSGNVAYRHFFKELTGEPLPDPAPLPRCPEK